MLEIGLGHYLALAAILMTGGVFGAKLGVSMNQYLNPGQLRLLLSLVVLAMGSKIAFDLVFGETAEFTLEAFK